MSLLTRHGLAAYERQLAFAEQVGDLPWLLRQEDRSLSLGDRHEFPAQLLGSESESSHTWLWAWANTTVSQAFAERALDARSIGEKQGIDVLVAPQFNLDRVGSAHFLAMATCGALGSGPYYRCPYDNGAAFVMIDVPPLMRPGGDLPQRLNHFLLTAIVDLPMLNSRRAIEGYLADIMVATNQVQGGLQPEDGPMLQFDDQDRLIGVGDR